MEGCPAQTEPIMLIPIISLSKAESNQRRNRLYFVPWSECGWTHLDKAIHGSKLRQMRAIFVNFLVGYDERTHVHTLSKQTTSCLPRTTLPTVDAASKVFSEPSAIRMYECLLTRQK